MSEENKDIEEKEEESRRQEDCAAQKQAEAPSPDEEGQNSGRESGDEQTKKAVCALAYLFGILFFLPLILYPVDDFARFHANQACVILIATVAGEVLFGILCAVLPILGILCGLFGLLMLIACIWAIVGVVKGEKTELPLLGRFRIIR